MNLFIFPVTKEHVKEIEMLHVANDQQNFIETTKECLAEAASLSLWKPVGIYNDNILVGFAMYGCFPQEGKSGRVWLDRFLIDLKYQGQHLGTKALELLIERLTQEYHCEEIYLSLYEENTHALTLYQKFDFTFNGELDINGEKVMVKKVKCEEK